MGPPCSAANFDSGGKSGMNSGERSTKRVRVGDRDVSVPNSTVIHRALAPFGKIPDSIQIEQIQRYVALLTFWNEKISLTTISDPEELLVRQFGEALVAVSAFSVEKGRLADVGSGAGFPGLALKIFAPRLDVVLIEKNAKKIAYLREAARFLSLEGISAKLTDYSAVSAGSDRFDWITAKALGGYPKLLEWARNVLSPSGSVILWLGVDDSEVIRRETNWDWQPAVAIPGSHRRVLLAGSPR